MTKPVRVVLSAANPGAASMIRVALNDLVMQPGIEVVAVVTQPPATDLLQPVCSKHGVLSLAAVAGRYIPPNDKAEEALLCNVEDLVLPLAPDAVLTGLSGPDVGVDEVLLYLAHREGWATYSIQDAPGWVVPGISGPATTYFVQDLAHARQTETVPGVRRAVPVGTLKLLAVSEAAFSRAAATRSGPGVMFIGQPLWYLPGYVRTLTWFAKAVTRADLGPLYYRAHPLEDTCTLASLSDIAIQLDDSASYEEALMKCEIVASCFSTGLQDAAQLAQLTGRRCPQLIYCLDQSDIRETFESTSQSLDLTISEQDFATFLLEQMTPNDLRAVLESRVDRGIRFSPPQPDRIGQIILEDRELMRFLPQNYAAYTDLKCSLPSAQLSDGNEIDLLPGLSEILDGIGRRIAPFEQVIPPQGGCHYLRTELEGHGLVFLKTIYAKQAERLAASMRLESAVAARCPHVAAPVLPAPIPLNGGDASLAIWPWLDGRKLDPESAEDMRAAGVALGRLHIAMQDIDMPTYYARARLDWLLTSWRRLQREMADGLLDDICTRFPWFSAVLGQISRGISDDFLSAQRQLVHGDLNPGNLFCMPGPLVKFIDFEEAIQSYLPAFFDLAMLIERHLLVYPSREPWQARAEPFFRAYLAETNSSLPYAGCLFDARCFSVLRSLIILVASDRAGRPWPDSEWHKFDLLSRRVMEQEDEMTRFAEAYLL